MNMEREKVIQFLIRKFVPNAGQTGDEKVRERYGVLAGTLGVICNLLLFAVKLPIGMLTGSMAITSDAFNNISDMGSSLVAVIGARLSGRKPDREHPFGHGRIEYISSLIISFIIMLVGLELFQGSLDKILHPEQVMMNPVMLGILALSMLVKVWMFSYNRYIGKKISSQVMRATAQDSLNDVAATGAVVLSSILAPHLPFSVDGVVGLAMSLMILYSGFGIARDTINLLLGSKADPVLVKKIADRVMQGQGIVGVHDLIVHDYGPGRTMASVHAEVPDNTNIVQIHEVIDELEHCIFQELGVEIVIHCDPISVNNERAARLMAQVKQVVSQVNPAFHIHDFRLTDGENRINLIFDMVVPCELSGDERVSAVEQVSRAMSELDARYRCVIQIDNEY